MDIENVIVALIEVADYLWSKQPRGYLSMLDRIDKELDRAMQEFSWK